MSLPIPEFLRDAARRPGVFSRRHWLNVAEVGCGDGERCRLWAARGHQVFGVDRDAGRIALARRHAFDGEREILFDVADAGALPWPDRSMDLCLGPALAATDADWRGMLDELARVLRPGGSACLGSGARLRIWRRRGAGVTLTAG